MILNCDSAQQEMFLNYKFDSINIKNFSITNDDEEIKYIPGKTYLFATFAAFGHTLLDVYGQYKVLQLKYSDIKPFFFENSSKGYLFNNNKVSQDILNVLGYTPNDIKNISEGNYLFEEIILFFDMNNTFPESFYSSKGITRTSHYFPFCSCYMGSENCGEGEYFKYNYLAIDLIVKSFSNVFSKDKTEKYFISRERYNNQYKKEIDYFSLKNNLSLEEEQQFYRAKIRYCENEKQIQEIFIKNGYSVVYPEDHGLFDQIKMFSSAKNIASISGASLFNILWGNSGTQIFEILSVPGYRYHYKEFANQVNVKHTYINIINYTIKDATNKILKIISNTEYDIL